MAKVRRRRAAARNQKIAGVAELGAFADSALLAATSTVAGLASLFAKISLSSPGL
jgi:hypothetical protein